MGRMKDLAIKEKNGESIENLIESAIEKINLCIGDLELENSYWISSTEKIDELDESEDLCYDCAKKKVEELTKKLGKKIEIYVDGGYETQESDSIIRCQCGKLLSYYLTEEGVKSELEHFLYLQTNIDLSNKEKAYQIGKILDCYNEVNDKYKIMIIELINKIW